VLGLNPTPAAAADGPIITFTEPPPGEAVGIVGRFRFGWTESDAAGLIFSRVVSLYVADPGGGACNAATYTLAWTDETSNRPDTFPIVNLGAGSCAYLELTATDSHGGSATARSGFVRAADAAPSEPRLDFSLPALGAATVVSGTGYYRVAWDEDVGDRTVDRTLVEQVGLPSTAGDCDTVADWKGGREFTPPGPVQAVDRLQPGFCYRYRVYLAYGRDSSASISSGALYVTRSPPSCTYGDVLATALSAAESAR